MSRAEGIRRWRKDNPEKCRQARQRYRANNKEKVSTALNNWRVANRTKILATELRQYGLSVEQYLDMANKQNGLCAICFKPQSGNYRLSVDHCHVTMAVRGLLCHSCNRLLGVYEANKIKFEGYLLIYGGQNVSLS